MPAGEDAGTIPPMGLGQRREQYSFARRSSGVSNDTPRWKRIRSKCGQSTFEHVADFWLGVKLPEGVGVVGTSVEATQAAKNLLKVTWSDAPGAHLDSERALEEFAAIGRDKSREGVPYEAVGDAKTAMRGAALTRTTADLARGYATTATTRGPSSSGNCELRRPQPRGSVGLGPTPRSACPAGSKGLTTAQCPKHGICQKEEASGACELGFEGLAFTIATGKTPYRKRSSPRMAARRLTDLGRQTLAG
jgi:hypothetical protein